MSLNLDITETSRQAYIWKMLEEDTVTDEESGEMHNASPERQETSELIPG